MGAEATARAPGVSAMEAGATGRLFRDFPLQEGATKVGSEAVQQLRRGGWGNEEGATRLRRLRRVYGLEARPHVSAVAALRDNVASAVPTLFCAGIRGWRRC
mmetsp:Transcript_23883/g.60937  ORF Transcript_23883/g.60937 Transcript_23883/m.60937 type:complete len:102 (-) Transcript_23883:11-316(-)